MQFLADGQMIASGGNDSRADIGSYELSPPDGMTLHATSSNIFHLRMTFTGADEVLIRGDGQTEGRLLHRVKE